MSTRNDGGPAFPVVSEIMGHCSGMTLRDYFIAHAPEEPQTWFQPVMPPYPETPRIEDIEDPEVRADVRSALDCGTDPETPDGQAWVEEYNKATSQQWHWHAEQTKQRYLRWPAAWADEMLKAREA